MSRFKEAVGGGILLAVLMLSVPLAGHVLWYWYERHAFMGKLDELHARGERLLPEDYWKGGISEDDAASQIRLTYQRLDSDDSVHIDSVDFIPSEHPFPEKAWPFLEQATTYFARSLSRVDQATSQPTCRWGHGFYSPLINMLLPELPQCRRVALLIVTSAEVEHHRHNDDEAIRRFGQILYLSDACEGSPTRVSHLVAAGLTEMVVAHLEGVVPELTIGSRPRGAIPSEELSKFIRKLCDESQTLAGLKYSLETDRAQIIDSYLNLTGTDTFSKYTAGPLTFHDARVALEQCRLMDSTLINSNDRPSAIAALKSIPVGQYWTNDELIGTNPDGLITTHFRVLADRRLLATATAIRSYQVDHGVRPATLAELVPAYLPSIPIDPMSPDDSPIKYVAAGADPYLYSVGNDGIDNGGSEEAMPGEYGDLGDWQRLDRTFHLTTKPHKAVYIPHPPSNGLMLGVGPGMEAKAPWDFDPTTQPPG